MVLSCQLHQYIGATDMVAPIYWWNCVSEQKSKYNYSKTAANFREKRTLIFTMQAKNKAFAIFPTPLISHCPLPLRLIISNVYTV